MHNIAYVHIQYGCFYWVFQELFWSIHLLFSSSLSHTSYTSRNSTRVPMTAWNEGFQLASQCHLWKPSHDLCAVLHVIVSTGQQGDRTFHKLPWQWLHGVNKDVALSAKVNFFNSIILLLMKLRPHPVIYLHVSWFGPWRILSSCDKHKCANVPSSLSITEWWLMFRMCGT